MPISTKPCYVIAELGVNHNGSLSLAKRLIDQAVWAGADAVKFQIFKAEQLATQYAVKANYQRLKFSDDESQLEMLRSLELKQTDFEKLFEYCKSKSVSFLATPFDEAGADFLVSKLKLQCLKIASGEITNGPLLLKIARFKQALIISTGMSDLGDVRRALEIVAFGFTASQKKIPAARNFMEAFESRLGQAKLKEKVTLLHCTSEYPAPVKDVNLNAMMTLKRAFGLPVGLSDHTRSIAVPIAAVAMGARVIEKHFTLNRDLPGPDHKASFEPHEFKSMVESIREIELSFGSAEKRSAEVEKKNRIVARRSLVAALPIKKGERFTQANLTAKRPAKGITPLRFWDFLGRKATKDYVPDELVKS